MNMTDIHNVYFIGIGGIGMSALARYFQFIGKQVGGYDKTRTSLTEELAASGMAIHYTDDLTLVPECFKTKENTLVVYTPAIPKHHSELNYFIANEFQVQKRAQVLGLITKGTYCFAVAGTHGKTTTSSILAHLLNEVNAPFSAFLGGISEDFNSNYVCKGQEYTVVEADEYDRSFLHLHPNMACVTSMDADHLDIYGDADNLKQTFAEFAGIVAKNGGLLKPQNVGLKGISYGIEDGSDYEIHNLEIRNGAYQFNIKTPKEIIRSISFSKPGRHNLNNALAALAMAAEAGFNANDLAKGLATFKGVQRRFSYQIKSRDFYFIDDYAHHPTEIEAVHQAVREMHPNLLVTVVFQPHLFSRTQDFMEGFAASLSKFDRVLLLDIYPAREEPIPGVDSGVLLEKITQENKRIIDKADLVQELQNLDQGVLLTLGAGDIGLEVVKIKKALQHAY
ncbi:UDP-N-acetylmuramate--L-alanine ligase [Croceivirga radicis]|uniref:UDP-N-acetylmuramate--L-alanine ligase n=1 Tax=Croceivirga radicis TaxID=1929488 RepID=UPI000497574E|nr:UDP-N-acetylmuramate--L-alanine ligase [Croceivirga radicis]